VAGCCECGDEPSGSFATELMFYITVNLISIFYLQSVVVHRDVHFIREASI
jgi:hypothetical protein